MSKRKAEEQENGNGDEDEASRGASKGGGGGLGSLLQSAPVVERLRNPFADDEDDDDDERPHGEDNDGENGSGGGSGGWNRGSWWRDVVRRKPKAGEDKERFGDGRDDSDEDGGSGTNSEDEEFGDFAMPEGEGSKEKSGEGESRGDRSSLDEDRDQVLLKPLPVHPPPGSGKSTAFSSLWPFGNQVFSSKDKDRGDDKSEGEKGSVEKGDEAETVDDPNIVSEDGKKVERAVEARRRTSIEDPDDDETEIVL